jgi:hypothetical protein
MSLDRARAKYRMAEYLTRWGAEPVEA